MDLFENLSDKQIEAVKTIDEDLEIIACAGAGKTGVVTRRIINILKSNPNILPENIVAFTFTEKAAEELKSRIYKYGEDVLGNTKGFANMYIGTIHGFCLKMLQEHIVQFQKFTVLDEIKTKLYIEKNYNFCGMPDLGLKIYTETNLFLNVISTLNENWFERDKWDVKTREAVDKYRDTFYCKNYFDYSLIMQEMLHQLETNKDFADIILNKIKYLTVDEYQDTNPIQERLIHFIKQGGCNLCIVGDDDQTIYQFRGSDPKNILTFKERYGIDKYIVLGTDYRSYLPYANPKLQDNMLEGAKKSIAGYVAKNQDDFANITMAEADIELDMGDGIKVNGRIDLVKRREISGEEKTYIVDFKTASREVTECINAEQLKIYALGYISSDVPFDNNPKEERTDILILDHPIALSDENNTGREFETIVIFELKRPMRDDYDARENPIQQLLGYVDKLSTNKVTDKNGRLIKVGSNTQFYLYAVCDLTPKMIKVAEDRDFIETPDKLGMYKYHEKKRAYIELISYDKLIGDAEKRNKVLFEKLGI